MESEGDTMEAGDPDVLTSYVSFYQTESSAFRAHLHGQATVPDPETDNPFLGWTASEADALFRGLAIYSRWRPDLIADSIPGKSTFSVCTYIDALEIASKELDEAIPRAEFSIAVETPDSLLNLEEQYATAILEGESSWEEALIEREIKSRKQAAEEPGPRHRARLEEYTAWKAALASQRERDGVFSSFDKVHFQVIDHILAQSVDAPGHLGKPQPQQDSEMRDTSAGAYDSLSRPQSPSSHASTSASTPAPTELPAQADLSHFSPTTRRRIRNRLHMRKKRANDDGDITVLQKRGRKKAKISLTTSEPQVAPDVERGPSSTKKRHKKPGKTRYERLKDQFAEWGMDGESLLASGLGLFRLKGLHNMMSSVGGDDGIPSAISADAIRLLTKFAADFVRRVMQHAIVSKEQELTLKRTTKVWRLGQSNEITVQDIDYALQLIGFELKDSGDDENSSTDMEQDDEEYAEDNPQFPVTLLSLLRETLPPVLRPPSPVHQVFYRSQQNLMPLESDEAAIAEELEEEEELDVVDEDEQTESLEEFRKIMDPA